MKQHIPNTFTEPVKAIFRLTKGHQAKTLETAPAKKDRGYDKDTQEHSSIK